MAVEKYNRYEDWEEDYATEDDLEEDNFQDSNYEEWLKYKESNQDD